MPALVGADDVGREALVSNRLVLGLGNMFGVQRMDGSEAAVRATVDHILALIDTAANGAQRMDHVSFHTMRGVHMGLSKGKEAIVQQVLEKL